MLMEQDRVPAVFEKVPVPFEFEHRLQFSFCEFLWSPVFSSDGKKLYVISYGETLDLGAIAWGVHAPSAVLGLLGLIALLSGLRMVMRTRSRPRVRGEAYCRRCNYRLTGRMVEKCSECGSSLAGRGRVVAGPQSIRRLSPVAFGVVVIACGAGVWFVEQSGVAVPKGWPAPKRWFDYAKERNWGWLASKTTFCMRLLEFDVESGRPERELARTPGFIPEASVLSADGSTFVAAGTNLWVVDARTGASRSFPRPAGRDWTIQSITGITDDGGAVFAVSFGLSGTPVIERIDLRTGACARIAEFSKSDAPGGSANWAIPEFAAISGGKFAVVFQSLDAWIEAPAKLAVIDAADPKAVRWTTIRSTSDRGRPVMTRDGSRLFIPTDRGLEGWDLATGESLGVLGFRATGTPAIDPTGRFLAAIAASGADSVWIRDMAEGKWIAIESGGSSRPWSLVLSPGGSALAGVVQAGQSGEVPELVFGKVPGLTK